jgi:sulfur carrier protein ThiS
MLMKITVKYHLSRDGCGLQERTVVLQEEATVRDLLEGIGLTPDEATAIFWNGKSALYSQILTQDDVVTILPFVSGG